MEEIKPEVETMSLTKEKYAELALLYELGLNLVHTIILNLAKVWAFYNDRGIYENIITRLKEYDSTLGKCKRKEVPTTLKASKAIFEISPVCASSRQPSATSSESETQSSISLVWSFSTRKTTSQTRRKTAIAAYT